jgi:hypothetical protein
MRVHPLKISKTKVTVPFPVCGSLGHSVGKAPEFVKDGMKSENSGVE